jgi:hypothetical protein
MKQKIKIPSMEIEVDSEEDCEFVATGEFRPMTEIDYFYSSVNCRIMKKAFKGISDDPYFIFKKAKPKLKLNYQNDWENVDKDVRFSEDPSGANRFVKLFNNFEITFSGRFYNHEQINKLVEDIVTLKKYYIEHSEFPEVG